MIMYTRSFMARIAAPVYLALIIVRYMKYFLYIFSVFWALVIFRYMKCVGSYNIHLFQVLWTIALSCSFCLSTPFSKIMACNWREQSDWFPMTMFSSFFIGLLCRKRSHHDIPKNSNIQKKNIRDVWRMGRTDICTHINVFLNFLDIIVQQKRIHQNCKQQNIQLDVWLNHKYLRSQKSENIQIQQISFLPRFIWGCTWVCKVP